MRRIGLALLLMTPCISAPGPAHAVSGIQICQEDWDCPDLSDVSDTFCILNRCTSVCASSSHCHDEDTCVGVTDEVALCFTTCFTSSSCPSGLTCLPLESGGGVCLPPSDSPADSGPSGSSSSSDTFTGNACGPDSPGAVECPGAGCVTGGPGSLYSALFALGLLLLLVTRRRLNR